jgi:hypothetical protein
MRSVSLSVFDVIGRKAYDFVISPERDVQIIIHNITFVLILSVESVLIFASD